MNVVFPAPFTPITRMTVGFDAANRIAGSAFPSRSAFCPIVPSSTSSVS